MGESDRDLSTHASLGLEKVLHNRTRKSDRLLEGYGENLFTGAVARPYLKAAGLTSEDLASGLWVEDRDKADKMADALRAWAADRNATSFCHWFQPIGSTYRHGQAGCVQLAFLKFDGESGAPVWNLDGGDLLQGETDGSSYNNGGLRQTHSAGGYLTVDPESPAFIRGDVMFLPACFVSYNGDSLDEKLPLKRAVQALSQQGKRLFAACGVPIEGLVTNIGLEQELFLVSREAYASRPDLRMTGRTVLGKMPPRGQEGCDHYMAPPQLSGKAAACLKEIQEECFKMGIPLTTRHREVAPNQYEMAPRFGSVVGQVDQNLVVMQIMDEVARKNELAALLIEKPFAGINGSGKHNNWSLSTKCGAQLYNPVDLTTRTGKTELFPVVMAATVAGVDKFGDLMRMSIACPGNDFRLGAMEAPPAVISTYLGEQLTTYLEEFAGLPAGAEVEGYVPKRTTIDLGVDGLPPISAPAEDRNRTSPFPYGGFRFEFRACGSSQNVGLINTVLDAMMAHEFKDIADRAEKGEDPVEVAKEKLKKHMKCVYNGNGYDEAWPEKAVEMGVTRIDSGVEAINTLSDPKNVELFTSLGIFAANEVEARKDIMLELYTGVVEMEAKCFIDMCNQQVIPAAKAADVDSAALQDKVAKVQAGLSEVLGESHVLEQARKARVLRLETMVDARKESDTLEGVIPSSLWPFAKYEDLLFMDFEL